MKKGDLVVVPVGASFYVAQVEGDASFAPDKVQEDSAYRRPVLWLNDKKPIPRHLARSALLSRMKVQGTTAEADDLLADIHECLKLASKSEAPTFQSDLQSRLIREVLAEMRSGRIESFGFERLIQSVLIGLGATKVRVVPRSKDKGADLLAEFRVAATFRYLVAIQAKHWQSEPPVGKNVVMQLINGIEAEEANLGMVVTSGTISDEAYNCAEQYYEDKGIRIELVDGEQFAKIIVEHGIRQEQNPIGIEGE
jgi:restriction endonuclease Mrr